jgi:hypothetical protein
MNRVSWLCAFALTVGVSPPVRAAMPAAEPRSAAEQRALAETFAPEFVFHPEEELFPCSPLLDTAAARSNGPVELANGSALGDNGTRVSEYLALSRADRFRAATVYYRVRPIAREGGTLVVEYWLYYLANRYAVRGGLVPFHLSDAHPHDLERVFVVIEPAPHAVRDGGPAYRIRSILASAHTAGIPDNRYSAPPGHHVGTPLQVLVERGSHAMALDIDRNLSFDAAIDSGGYRKLVWGIRDFGDTWAAYRPSYADARPSDAVLRLTLESDADETRTHGPNTGRYRLKPVSEIEERLPIESWSSADRVRIFGRVSLLKRIFGEVDSGQLLRPSAHADGRDSANPWRRVGASESGLMLGLTTINVPYSWMAGARHTWLNDSHWPDLQLDGTVLFPVSKKPVYEATVFQTYPIDVIARLMLGQAVRWDEQKRIESLWLVGVEWRVNRWRIRGMARNPHNRAWLEFRIFYLL